MASFKKKKTPEQEWKEKWQFEECFSSHRTIITVFLSNSGDPAGVQMHNFDKLSRLYQHSQQQDVVKNRIVHPKIYILFLDLVTLIWTKTVLQNVFCSTEDDKIIIIFGEPLITNGKLTSYTKKFVEKVHAKNKVTF